MKFIHVDIDRAERRYNNYANRWNRRAWRPVACAHREHIQWPPDRVERLRRMRLAKPGRKWRRG